MSLDLVAFESDVLDILKGSPLADLLTKGLTFNPHDWSGDIAEIQALASATVASVQIVKTNLQTAHPDEPWNHICIETAAKILRDSIVLPGFWGHVEAFLLGPILRGILEGALGAFKIMAQQKNWLALAKAALALAV